MAERPRPALVGVFVIAGAILAALAVTVWGSGRLFERTYRYVCYFNGSVNGLDVGAPVKFRGVTVGSVVDMKIAFNDRPEEIRIPVVIEVRGRRVRGLGATRDPTPAAVRVMVENGMRAQLGIQSLVTGQLYVALDFHPESPPVAWQQSGRYPEIPTVRTTLEEATRTFEQLLAQVQKADLAGMARSVASAVEGVNQLVNQPAVATTLAELPSTVAAIRQLARVLGGDLHGVSVNLDATLAELRRGLDDARTLAGARQGLGTELQRTLVEVQRAAASVQALADFLRRNPNALLVGRKRP